MGVGCGKICYATKQKVIRALAAIRRRRRKNPEKDYYWCDWCGAYHTTRHKWK